MFARVFFVVGFSVAAAVGSKTSRAQARADTRSEYLGDGCGEGVTTTQKLVYVSMDLPVSLFSLRGLKSHVEDVEVESETGESSDSAVEVVEQAGNATHADESYMAPTPLCMALFKSIRNFEKTEDLHKCVRDTKMAMDEASLLLQDFDEEGAQSLLHPTFGVCLNRTVNAQIAQLAQGGGCMAALAKDFVEFEMKNKGKGVSMQCKAEACIKYKENTHVEECARKFDDKLEEAESIQDAAKVYEQILTGCAGVSTLCARQNGYPMAFRANQRMLKSIGIGAGIR